MIEIENLEEFCTGVLDYVEDTKKVWTVAYRAWGQLLFETIVKESPQWSGNFAANWNYGVGAESSYYQDIPEYRGAFAVGLEKADFKARFRGHSAAVAVAMQRAKFDAPSLTTPVYINNLTGYANGWVNDPEILRPRNYIDPTPIPLGHATLVADALWDRVSYNIST